MLEAIVDWMAQFWERNGTEMILTAAIILGAIVILWFARRAILRWTNSIEVRYEESGDHDDKERAQRTVTLASVAQMLVTLVVWVTAILTVMALWGIPLAPFLAIGTMLGVAVGFGAQDLVKDVIAGFFILVEDQFGIGDVVSIAEVSGTVEAIKLRTTVLRDLNGHVHHVPNGEIAVASNMTQSFSRVVTDVGVSYSTDVDEAIEVIEDEAMAMANDPTWAASFLRPPEMLGVSALDDSAVVIRVVSTVVSERHGAVKREFNRRIKNRLDAEGIEMPFNYMTVVIQTDES